MLERGSELKSEFQEQRKRQDREADSVDTAAPALSSFLGSNRGFRTTRNEPPNLAARPVLTGGWRPHEQAAEAVLSLRNRQPRILHSVGADGQNIYE